MSLDVQKKINNGWSQQKLWWVMLTLVLVHRYFKQMGAIQSFPNVSLLFAFCFISGLAVTGVRPYWIISLMVLLVDWASMGERMLEGSRMAGFEVAINYALLFLTSVWASRYFKQSAFFKGLLGMISASLFYYLISNTVSFLSEPSYVKNMQGYIQCLTTGLPGIPPTWTFLRNSLVSNCCGFSVLYILFQLTSQHENRCLIKSKMISQSSGVTF
jgi:hypothetical protein